jgi:hypothetical protein
MVGRFGRADRRKSAIVGSRLGVTAFELTSSGVGHNHKASRQVSTRHQ